MYKCQGKQYQQKNVNTLINFAKSYAKTGEEIRGKRLTWGDICDQNKNGQRC